MMYFKVSIISLGRVLEVVYHQSIAEYHIMGKNTCLANIKATLVENVSEKIKYGKICSRVSSDFKSTMSVAYYILFGM